MKTWLFIVSLILNAALTFALAVVISSTQTTRYIIERQIEVRHEVELALADALEERDASKRKIQRLEMELFHATQRNAGMANQKSKDDD